MSKNLFLAAALTLSAGCMYRATPIVNSVDVTAVDWSKVSSMKHGSTCATFLFGAIPISGSTSLVKAVEDAGVSEVTVLSTRFKNYVLYSQNCLEVWGQ